MHSNTNINSIASFSYICRRCTKTLVAILAFSAAAVAAWCQDDRPLMDYPCDDKSGIIIHDAGPDKLNGTLNAKTNSEERGVTVACDKFGEWQPVLTEEGFQRKGIVKGSDAALAESDDHSVLENGKDYILDNDKGLLKALNGGRVELNRPFALEFKYSNPGPVWVEGRGTGALRFDGVDDFATLGKHPVKKMLSALTMQMWIRMDKDTYPDAILLAHGLEGPPVSRFGLRLKDGNFQFFHPTLKNADGKPAVATASAIGLNDETWHHLAAVFDGSAVVLYVDGKETTRQAQLSGQMELSRPFLLGGIHDPEFLKGQVCRVKILPIASPASEIAKGAAVR